MVSSLLADLLQDPTRLLLELFDHADPVDEFPAIVFRQSSNVFNNVDAFQEVSSLRPSYCV